MSPRTPAVVHAAEEACPWGTEDEAVAALVEKSRIRMELCDSAGDADRECAKAVSDLLEEVAAHCGRKSHAEAAEADNANRCIEVPGDTYTSAGEVAYRSAAALRNVCSETAHVAMWSWSNAAGKPGVAVQGHVRGGTRTT